MTGAVTRKIELAKQIEEASRLVSEGEGGLGGSGRQRGMAEERLNRRRAILRTLEWNRDNEHTIRAWAEAQKQRLGAGTEGTGGQSANQTEGQGT